MVCVGGKNVVTGCVLLFVNTILTVVVILITYCRGKSLKCADAAMEQDRRSVRGVMEPGQ